MTPPMPQMPGHMRAALLDRGAPQLGPPEPINEGQVLPVGANDVAIAATHNEVTLTFRLANGGGGPDQPLTIQETAKVVMSWDLLESLNASAGGLLTQALAVRLESTKAKLLVLETVQAMDPSQPLSDGPSSAD